MTSNIHFYKVTIKWESRKTNPGLQNIIDMKYFCDKRQEINMLLTRGLVIKRMRILRVSFQPLHRDILDSDINKLVNTCRYKWLIIKGQKQ